MGLPSLIGRGKKKKASFNYIKERVWRKLQGWEGKLFSQTGREVFIKAIIQVIPTFAMGCFKLPMVGTKREKRKIHWLKWGEMTRSKSEGGMGFRDLAWKSNSLLAKQAWH